MKLVADITTEELEKLEREFRSGTSSVKSIKEFVSPQDLYQELIASIKKYHPSADISLVEKAYKVALDAETAGGNPKAWTAWIPKSAIVEM